jgi:ATP-dependent helicase STH1/SNF2
MFNNARTYNQEGSWVYVDAEEMERVFNAAWNRVIAGSGLPGAPPAAGLPPSTSMAMEDERPSVISRGRGRARQVALSDDDDSYLTPSDDE